MFIPQIILIPFSGVIADRWNKKAIITISDTIQAFVTFLLFICYLIDFQNIWFVLGINTFRSALNAFQLLAVQSLIHVMVPKDNLSRVNSLNFLCSGVIYSIGLVIAAILLSFFSLTQIFLVDIVIFMIALVPLLIIKVPKIYWIKEESSKKTFFKDFKTGLLTIKMIPGLFTLISFAMIWNFLQKSWAVLISYLVYYIRDRTSFHLALLTPSMQIAIIIGALITRAKKTWKHKIKINIIGGSLVYLFLLPVILAPKGNFILIMIFIFTGGIIFPIIGSTYQAILQKVVSKDKIGRIISIDHMISMAITPIGVLIVGSLAELIGIINSLLISAIIGAIFPYFVWTFSKIRQLEIIDREKATVVEKIEEDIK